MGIWLFLAATAIARQQSCSWSQVQQRRATCAFCRVECRQCLHGGVQNEDHQGSAERMGCLPRWI